MELSAFPSFNPERKRKKKQNKNFKKQVKKKKKTLRNTLKATKHKIFWTIQDRKKHRLQIVDSLFSYKLKQEKA